MSDKERILHIISNETKNSIEQMSVVTPSIFASIYSNFAKEHNTDLDNEDELSHDLLRTECSTLVDMQIKHQKMHKT